ncbi:MAG: DUF4271 domain-containing protein [Bacteroidales bacterium]
MQDSVSYKADSISNIKIENPLFVIPDSLKSESTTISFKQYIKILNDYTPVLVERKSLFKYKNYYVSKDIKMIEREVNPTYGWIFGLIFISILIYGIFIKAFYSKIKLIFKGVYSNITVFPISILLFVPNFSLLIYAPLIYYNYLIYSPINSHFGTYLLIVLVALIFFLIKYVLIYFFGILFRLEALCSKYNFNHTLFFITDGLVLIPFVFLFYFLPNNLQFSMLIASIIAISILFLFRLLRGFALVFKNTKASQFYLFVYLCTVEFLPIIIIYKYLFS